MEDSQVLARNKDEGIVHRKAAGPAADDSDNLQCTELLKSVTSEPQVWTKNILGDSLAFDDKSVLCTTVTPVKLARKRCIPLPPIERDNAGDHESTATVACQNIHANETTMSSIGLSTQWEMMRNEGNLFEGEPGEE